MPLLHSVSVPVLKARRNLTEVLPPGLPGPSRVKTPPKLLHTSNTVGWRAARSGPEERLDRIALQFEPRIPLSPAVRRGYMSHVASEVQLKATQQNRPGYDLALRRRDAASGVGLGEARKTGTAPQSVILERELELAEACEKAAKHPGENDAGAEAARKMANASFAALEACAALAPRAFGPLLGRISVAFDTLLRSPDTLDDYGAPMLYKTVVEQVVRRERAVDGARLDLLQYELGATCTRLEARDEAVLEAKGRSVHLERRTAKLEARLARLQRSYDECDHERQEFEATNALLVEDAEGAIEGRLSKLLEQIERLNEEVARCRKTEEALIGALESAVPREEHAATLAELDELGLAHEQLRAQLTLSAQREQAARNAVLVPSGGVSFSLDMVLSLDQQLELPDAGAGVGVARGALALPAEVELAQMKMTHTPRPAWANLRDRADREAIELPSDVVGSSFGQRRPWLVPNKSTAHNMNALYASYRGARLRIAQCDLSVPSDEPFFRAVGAASSVPAHLRWPAGERLRNWRLGKREVEDAVRDFWDVYDSEVYEQRSAQSPNRPALPITDHFEAFLQQYPTAKEFLPDEAGSGGQRSVREYAYNLIDGCKRYHHDADMELFLEVISGRLPEATHRRQMAMLASLLDELVTEDEMENKGKAKGVVSRNAIAAVLRKVFPTRTEEQIGGLVETVDKDCEAVKYEDLFLEDLEGNQSSFIERVRDQWLRAPRDFVNQIEAALCGKEGCAESGLVMRLQAFSAISACDPKKSDDDVAKLVALGFGDASVEVYDDGARIELALFSQRLLLGFPARSGKPPATMPGVRESRRSVAGVGGRARLARASVFNSLQAMPLSPGGAAGSPGGGMPKAKRKSVAWPPA